MQNESSKEIETTQGTYLEGLQQALDGYQASYDAASIRLGLETDPNVIGQLIAHCRFALTQIAALQAMLKAYDEAA